MITLGGSYHAGFNFGFNIAESVNFVTDDWLPSLYKYKHCKCHPKNVRMDPETVLQILDKRLLTRTPVREEQVLPGLQANHEREEIQKAGKI